MSSRWIKNSIVAVWLISLCLPAIAMSAQLQGPPKRGESGRRVVQVPDLTLTDQEGRPFPLRSLHGKLVLVTFIYTACPDVCPLLTAKFADIQQSLKRERRDDYFLLSITTDPGADTPQVLKGYAQRFGADLHTWAFLTGNKKDLSKAWNAFGVKVKKLGKGQIQHTGLTTLIDRQGIRRIDYFGDAWSEKEVLKEIAELAKAS